MSFGLVSHALDFFFTETGGALNGDVLLLAGGFVLGLDGQDAGSVDVESDLDLRDAARGGWNAVKDKATDGFVVSGHFALALQDVYFDRRLIVGGGRKSLGLAGRDGRVAVNQGCADTTKSFNTESKWGDVEEEDVFDFTAQDTALNGSADGDDFVGVDAFVRSFAEETFNRLRGLWHG